MTNRIVQQSPDRWPYSHNDNRYVLELAKTHSESRTVFGFDPDDCHDVNFVGTRVQMLEEEGYINVEYSDRLMDNGKIHRQIDSMSLTPKGEEHLSGIRAADWYNSVVRGARRLLVVVITSVIASVVTVLIIKSLELD